MGKGLRGSGLAETAQARGYRAMSGTLTEGLRLRDVDQSGIDEAKDLIRSSLPAIMESPLTDRNIGDQYAGMLEDIARQRAADMEAVTQYTGAAGLRGGVAADMVAQVELGSLGAVSRGMRDLRAMQTEVEARHKITQLNATLGAGQMLSMAPSTLGYESLANIAEYYGGIFDVERAGQFQRDAAVEARQGALAGGALGVVGDLVGAAGAFA
jgi:hypothetical protein